MLCLPPEVVPPTLRAASLKRARLLSAVAHDCFLHIELLHEATFCRSSTTTRLHASASCTIHLCSWQGRLRCSSRHSCHKTGFHSVLMVAVLCHRVPWHLDANVLLDVCWPMGRWSSITPNVLRPLAGQGRRKGAPQSSGSARHCRALWHSSRETQQTLALWLLRGFESN